MRPFRLIAAVAAVLVVVGPSRAQVGGGFGQRHAVGVHVRTGPYNSLTYVAGAYGFGFGPIYGPVPSWYYGWPGVPLVPNPIVVQPSPPVVIQNIIQPPGGVAVPDRHAFVPPEFDPPPAKPAPKPGRQAPPVVPVLPPAPPKPPAALVGRVDADRVAEAGHKAFADGQYGRALELFRRAAEIMPNEPSNQYLIAQAEFAISKYREAVAAIAAGMALRPDWAEARFASRALYWKKPDVFDEHLTALRQAVAAFPDDAGLVFLLGHQLWFDGQRDAARPLFQKAAALGNGQTPAAAFLAR